MMKFVMALETIGNKFERTQALLSMFAREFIDVTKEELQYNIETNRDGLNDVYAAIQELVIKYIAEIDELIEQYHVKAKEVMK